MSVQFLRNNAIVKDSYAVKNTKSSPCSLFLLPNMLTRFLFPSSCLLAC